MKLIDRVLSHCEIGDCWTWQRMTLKGYGYVSVNGKMKRVHRVVWEELVSPIPDGLEIDHLCSIRACCNPDHLEVVTHAENVRRGTTGQNSRGKTHCPKGHPYSGVNLYVCPRGRRECRECRRNAKRRHRIGERMRQEIDMKEDNDGT